MEERQKRICKGQKKCAPIYEEQWTEHEFEKICQVDSPESPKLKEELKELTEQGPFSENGYRWTRKCKSLKFKPRKNMNEDDKIAKILI
ncbi:hypothetical protein LguiA_034577 [Lonicera macranthoides]